MKLKLDLKLNLINNGSTAKWKCCQYIRKTLEYNDIDGFEFWLVFRVLIKFTGSLLRTKHMNLTTITLMRHVHVIDVALITCKLLIYKLYLVHVIG